MGSSFPSKPDLLFDVDGVLVHPPFQFRDYLARNYVITQAMTAPFFDGPFHACVTGQADLQDELGAYLNQWRWPGTAATFLETWLREDNAPDGVVLKTIASLRSSGFKCHVASVQERNRAAYLRHGMGFERVFDQTFFSCDLGVAKPDPAFFIKIQERLAKPPQELFLVDDSLSCIEAARRVGWQTFHYCGPADLARLISTIAALGPT